MSSCHNDIIFHQHVTNLTFIIILTIILLYALIKIYKPIYITLSTLTIRYNIYLYRDKKRQIFCENYDSSCTVFISGFKAARELASYVTPIGGPSTS